MPHPRAPLTWVKDSHIILLDTELMVQPNTELVNAAGQAADVSPLRAQRPARIQVRTPSAVQVCHLFISSGHNFFGHYGGPAGDSPIIPVDYLECVAGRGLRGDRFFDYKPDYKGQITFFSIEVFESLRRELNLPHVQPQATRRNAFVRGLDLIALVGREFEVQGVRFGGVEESKPCYWMNSALGPGAEEWLRGRGGLRCRILSDGLLVKQAN